MNHPDRNPWPNNSGRTPLHWACYKVRVCVFVGWRCVCLCVRVCAREVPVCERVLLPECFQCNC